MTSKRLVLVLPFYGASLPLYFNYWLASLSRMAFDVLLISDMRQLDDVALPSNVVRLKMSLTDMQLQAERALGCHVALTDVRKLCDLKPFYGRIFEQAIAGYDYWAFGDADLIYGRDMYRLVFDAVAGDPDVVSFCSKWISGAFCVIRNDERGRTLYSRADNWKEVLGDPTHVAFDELSGLWYDDVSSGRKTIEDCSRVRDSFTAVVWRSSDLNVRWMDGLCEDALNHCQTVEMCDGRLTIDRIGIPLFHYVNAKKRRRFTYEKLGDARHYLIDDAGFYATPIRIKYRRLFRRWRIVSSDVRWLIYKAGALFRHSPLYFIRKLI